MTFVSLDLSPLRFISHSMKGIHPQGDLAPRDIVSRAIFHEQQFGHDLYLNISEIPHFSVRFPAIAAMCERAGVDMASGRLPVSPGMHFLMGGICVNEYGETTVPSLFAIGEAACTGLHGANRLASNSLLEGLVLGNKAARRIEQFPKRKKTIPSSTIQESWSVPEISEKQLSQWMMTYAAIVRDEDGLKTLLQSLLQVPYQQINVKDITIFSALSKLIHEENFQAYANPAHIAGLVIRIHENYAESLKKNIVFHYDEDGQHPVYHVYTILSLLNNIVSNAVEAIPVDGQVSLSISQKENHVVFQISDNGPGIKERNHHVIFKPGFTLKYDQAGNPSSGIGLSYVKDTAEKLGGSVEMQSVPNKQTTFTLTIPMDQVSRKEGIGR
ncbi:ATP-binding protein [Bacillus subtilis]|uniref:ATP-binding protein n=1 Tax=Bacillus subtilis TaxID=1423 RepID=UPI003EC02213